MIHIRYSYEKGNLSTRLRPVVHIPQQNKITKSNTKFFFVCVSLNLFKTILHFQFLLVKTVFTYGCFSSSTKKNPKDKKSIF
jgi:hypothetical protein